MKLWSQRLQLLWNRPVEHPDLGPVAVQLDPEDEHNIRTRSNAPVDGREVPLESWQPELKAGILFGRMHDAYAIQ